MASEDGPILVRVKRKLEEDPLEALILTTKKTKAAAPLPAEGMSLE